MNQFADRQKRNTSFIVRNISTEKKVIRIFQYPILPGTTRDLLASNGVSESDIRASLLKGELLTKLLANEITITFSDIDLIQFNTNQKNFLQSKGVTTGTEVISNISSLPYVVKQNIPLIGVTNSINRVFTTPDKFINTNYNGNEFRIQVRHNGRILIEGIEYNLLESGGIGTGYDTIYMTGIVPNSNSKIVADYVVLL